jgi:hypothetical protein
MQEQNGGKCLCGRPIPDSKIKKACFTCRLLRCTGCGLYAAVNGVNGAIEIAGFLRLVEIKGRGQLIEARKDNWIPRNRTSRN